MMKLAYCKPWKFLFLSLLLLGGGKILDVQAQNEKELKVEIRKVTPKGVGPSIGYVELSDTPQGLKITPHLRDLSPGDHGFHVHEKPNCAPAEKEGVMIAAGAAGGHYDPKKAAQHLGPYGHGHEGDLPRLTVNQNGVASTPVIAPHLTLGDIQNRSLMIHEGGDNYSDKPKELGGGGARIACGIIGSTS